MKRIITAILIRMPQDNDGLGRVQAVNDPAWGTTSYDRRANGQVTKVTYPDLRTTEYADFDPKTDAPKATTRADDTTQSSTLNTKGQATSSTGAGAIPLAYGYQGRTGQLTTLTTARSGLPTDASNATKATTTWVYDEASGLLKTKQWANGSQETFSYNAAFQLTGSTRPGQSTSFSYNTAGEWTGSTTTDATHGNLTDAVAGRDDLGRPLVWTQVVTSIATGLTRTATTTTAYTALDQMKLDLSGESGAGTVYEYYGPTDNGSRNSSGVLLAGQTQGAAPPFGDRSTTYTCDANGNLIVPRSPSPERQVNDAEPNWTFAAGETPLDILPKSAPLRSGEPAASGASACY